MYNNFIKKAHIGRWVMNQHKKENQSKKKITEEILHQIGGSVILVLLLIAVVAICMVGWLSLASKKSELIRSEEHTSELQSPS